MSREIDSIHDIEESDVQTAYDFAQLCRALAAYAENRPEYKHSEFDAASMRFLADEAESIYEQLAVVYAGSLDQKVDPTELIE